MQEPYNKVCLIPPSHPFYIVINHFRRRKWQPTPVFLPGEFQGQRSLVGCRLWSRTELDTTEATYQQQQHSFYLSEFYNYPIHCDYYYSKQLSFRSLRITKVEDFVLLYFFSNALPFYIQMWVSDLLSFTFSLKIFFNISYRVDIMMVNSYSFCLSEKVLFLFYLGKTISLDIGFKVGGFFL